MRSGPFLARDLLLKISRLHMNSPDVNDRLGMIQADSLQTEPFNVVSVGQNNHRNRAELPAQGAIGLARPVNRRFLAAGADRAAPGNLDAGPRRPCVAGAWPQAGRP